MCGAVVPNEHGMPAEFGRQNRGPPHQHLPTFLSITGYVPLVGQAGAGTLREELDAWQTAFIPIFRTEGFLSCIGLPPCCGNESHAVSLSWRKITELFF